MSRARRSGRPDKRRCDWCGGTVTRKNRVVHRSTVTHRTYVFNHPSCRDAFVADAARDDS